MNVLNVALVYLLFLVSFAALYAAIGKGQKFSRIVILIVYLAAGTYGTVLVVGEILTPSIDANIGLGLSMLLMMFVGVSGMIVAVVTGGLRLFAKR